MLNVLSEIQVDQETEITRIHVIQALLSQQPGYSNKSQMLLMAISADI